MSKVFMITLNISNLNVKITSEKLIVALIFQIDDGNIHMAMTLVNQDITIIFQIVVLKCEIWYLITIIFSLVLYSVDIVTKDKYL